MLLFKRKFLDAIRTGEKTQTIRLWKHRRMRAGQASYIPGIGRIHVVSVERVEISDLTEQDAARDGFATLADLHAELAQIYAEQPARQAYRVSFSVLPAAVSS